MAATRQAVEADNSYSGRNVISVCSFQGAVGRRIDILWRSRRRCLKWAKLCMVLPCEIAGVKSYKMGSQPAKFLIQSGIHSWSRGDVFSSAIESQ